MAGSRGFCLDHLRRWSCPPRDQLGPADLERFLADVLPLAEAGLGTPRRRGATISPSCSSTPTPGPGTEEQRTRPLAGAAVPRGTADEEGVGACRERTRQRARRARGTGTANRRGSRGAARAGRRCPPRRPRVRVRGHRRAVGRRGPRGDLPAADERGQGEQGPAACAPASSPRSASASSASAAARLGVTAGHLPGAPRRHAREHDGAAPGDRGRHPALPAAPPPHHRSVEALPDPPRPPGRRPGRAGRGVRGQGDPPLPRAARGRDRAVAHPGGVAVLERAPGPVGGRGRLHRASASPRCGATRARSTTTRSGSRRTYRKRGAGDREEGKQAFEYAEAFKVLRW